jgi:hypothetical protein
MPRYDFSCFMDHVFEHFVSPAPDLQHYQVACPECGGPAKWKPSAQVQPEFKPFYHEHLGPHPVRIESREQYRTICREKEVYGPYNEGDRAKTKGIEKLKHLD